MPDFSALLSKPTDEIKKPKRLPDGSFLGLITAHKFDEAKTPKDTENPVKPICRLSVKLQEAMDDVDQADLEEALGGSALSARPAMNYDLWLTNDAQYRVVELAQSCGIATEGTTLGEIIPELTNKSVIVSIIGVQSKKPGQEEVWFSNIGSLVGTEGAAA